MCFLFNILTIFSIEYLLFYAALAGETRDGALTHRVAYCVACLKCDNIVPLADGDSRAFLGDTFFIAGCTRLRSFKKSAVQKMKKREQKMSPIP